MLSPMSDILLKVKTKVGEKTHERTSTIQSGKQAWLSAGSAHEPFNQSLGTYTCCLIFMLSLAGLESPTSNTLRLSVRSFPENKKEDTMGIKVQFTIQPTATQCHEGLYPQTVIKISPSSPCCPCQTFGQNKITSNIHAPDPNTFNFLILGTQHIILSVSSGSQCHTVCTEAFSIKCNFVPSNPNQLHPI